MMQSQASLSLRTLAAVPEGLGSRPLRILGMVALALLFEEYDTAMLISALKQIALELGMRDSDLGWHMGLIRLGALPAFALVPLADRFGRRPMFLASTTLLGLVVLIAAVLLLFFPETNQRELEAINDAH